MGLKTGTGTSPGGEDRDANDAARLRHARDRHSGFAVGQYLQPAPLLFTRDGHNAFLGDMYRGRSAFLVCAGPSLTSHDLSQLSRRGVLTMAVNNAAAVVRPNLWCSVDDPGNFCDAVWRDPGILKFVPLCHMEKPIWSRDAAGQLVETDQKVGDMPAVFGFRRNEAFVAEQFLREDTINWGNHGKRTDAYGQRGSRSVMLAAFRLLHFLGARQVFLVGCDFRMEIGKQNYAFEQDRTSASVRGNNSTYSILNVRLQHLRPFFEADGFQVHNCTPNSGLTAFPHMDYADAVSIATAEMPVKINTAGMYDRQARERTWEPATAPPNSPADDVTPEEVLSRRPRFSVVVPVRQGDAPFLANSWRTWIHHKPWLRHCPLLFIGDDSGVAAECLSTAGAAHPEISWTQFVPATAASWEFDMLDHAIEHIHTPWYLLLHPRAIATQRRDWITTDLTQTDRPGANPVFYACRWGYTKPADIFHRLDQWADTIGELARSDRLDWPYDDTSDRIAHDAISSWAFLGDRDWTQETLALRESPPPTNDWATYSLFCASRQRRPFVRLPVKEYGWDHSFAWTVSKHASRCERALATR